MQKIKVMLIAIIATIFLTGCELTTVDSGEAGVKVNAGKVDKEIVTPGFFFSINPMVELVIYNTKAKMVDMNMANQDKKDTREVMYERPVTILTTENLTVPIDVSILYRVKSNKLVEIYTNYGRDTIWEPKLVIKKARAVIREAIGKASVYDLNKNRSKYEATIIKKLQDRLGEYITVEQVNINNIPLPDKIVKAVEAKMVESERAKSEEYKLKTIKIQAQQEIAKKKGEAEAQAILKKTITKEMIEWRKLDLKEKALENERLKIEKWDGKLPNTMVSSDKQDILLNIK